MPSHIRALAFPAVPLRLPPAALAHSVDELIGHVRTLADRDFTPSTLRWDHTNDHGDRLGGRCGFEQTRKAVVLRQEDRNK